MRLTSTRRAAPEVSFTEALLRGLAPDGGLYLPTELPRIEPAELASWRGLPIADVAARVLGRLVGDEFDREAFDALIRDAFDVPAPAVRLSDSLAVLELFHGPTLAFKDFGARFLARAFGHVLVSRGDHATILVATSGDTGSAVALGFHGVPRVRVVVLYPGGKVSAFQEAQMATLGGNVTAVRVPGAFDDCQRLVKQAFLDKGLAGLNLSSANSINIGRLLPQAVYYFSAWLELGAEAAGDIGFAVPSGNLGNLTAGVIAQRLGLPVRRFIAACNVNDVLPEFLRTGDYRARPARPTISNAMDVGDPSNFPRLAELHGNSLASMRRNLTGVSVSEEQTRQAIRQAHEESGYVLDPHGAVAYAASRRVSREAGEPRPIVTLATAHPATFGEVIREELGRAPELPEGWRDWASRPLRAVDLKSADYADFKALMS